MFFKKFYNFDRLNILYFFQDTVGVIFFNLTENHFMSAL
jgi:hypothetical protein